MFADKLQRSVAAFLDHAALLYYRDLDVRGRCIMTDNAKVFARSHSSPCAATRSYGVFLSGAKRGAPMASRVIQTALRPWAHGYTYRHSREHTAYLPSGCVAIAVIDRIQHWPHIQPSTDGARWRQPV